MTKVPRRAFGYARVSTIAQATEGESLAVQQERLEALCTLNGLALHEVFTEEGVSGAKPFRQRPAGARLWASLREGDVLVSEKLDRLTRSPQDALSLLDACRKKSVGLIIADMGVSDVTKGAVSAMLVGVLASVASFERQRTGERVAEVKAAQKRDGRYLGGPIPFAHILIERDGERFVQVDEALRERVMELKRRCGSVRQICFALAGEGIAVCQPAMAKFLREQLASAA